MRYWGIPAVFPRHTAKQLHFDIQIKLSFALFQLQDSASAGELVPFHNPVLFLDNFLRAPQLGKKSYSSLIHLGEKKFRSAN